MTLGQFLNQMGIGPKHLTERFSHADYGAGAGVVGHDPHLLYAHEPPHVTHHVADSKHHHHHGGGHKDNAAMSALTLLAFLFFLHILQQCLREHMAAMSTPQLVVMTGGREGEQNLAKTAMAADQVEEKSPEAKSSVADIKIKDSKFKYPAKDAFTKILTAEYTPRLQSEINKNRFRDTNSFPGFFSAMDE